MSQSIYLAATKCDQNNNAAGVALSFSEKHSQSKLKGFQFRVSRPHHRSDKVFYLTARQCPSSKIKSFKYWNEGRGAYYYQNGIDVKLDCEEIEKLTLLTWGQMFFLCFMWFLCIVAICLVFGNFIATFMVPNVLYAAGILSAGEAMGLYLAMGIIGTVIFVLGAGAICAITSYQSDIIWQRALDLTIESLMRRHKCLVRSYVRIAYPILADKAVEMAKNHSQNHAEDSSLTKAETARQINIECDQWRDNFLSAYPTDISLYLLIKKIANPVRFDVVFAGADSSNVRDYRAFFEYALYWLAWEMFASGTKDTENSEVLLDRERLCELVSTERDHQLFKNKNLPLPCSSKPISIIPSGQWIISVFLMAYSSGVQNAGNDLAFLIASFVAGEM